MKEIVVVQIGQCGNQTGIKFWEVLADEHGIKEDGSKRKFLLRTELTDIFFNEKEKENMFEARCALIDTDPFGLDIVKKSIYRKIFPNNSFVLGTKDTGHNWAVGRFTEGLETAVNSLDVIRKQAEACDLMQGFKIIHGIGGGTGSGLGSLMMIKLKEEYPKKILSSYSILPYCKIETNPLEPYNSLLALSQMVYSTDKTYCFDNSSLYSICTDLFRLPCPNFSDMNHLVASTMASITSCFRFNCDHGSGMRHSMNNSVPFPRLHFFITGYAPLVVRGSGYRLTSVKSLVQQLLCPASLLVHCNPIRGSYLTSSALFRGNISLKEIDSELNDLQSETVNFVDWVPKGIKYELCEIPSRGCDRSATLVANTTAVQQPLRAVRNKVKEMLQQKKYLPSFTEEGMELSDFDQAMDTVLKLCTEYQHWQEPKLSNDLISQLEASPQDLVVNQYPL